MVGLARKGSVKAEFIKAARDVCHKGMTASDIERKLGPQFTERLSARTIRDLSLIHI